MDLFSYAKQYYNKWRVTPVPITYNSDNHTPLVKWGELASNPNPLLIGDVWGTASGIAILPRGNHVVVDIDEIPGAKSKNIIVEIARQLAKDGLAVVLTKRGLHIHAQTERPVGELRLYVEDYGKYKRVGEGGGALYRHLWTVPPTNRNGFTYKFVNSGGGLTTNVPELIQLSFKDFVLDIDSVLGIIVQEVKHASITGTNATLDTIDPVPGIEKLNAYELLALLVAVYHAIECKGLRDLLLEWSTTGVVNMRKFAWANRTSRFYLLHTVAASLALLGASEQQVSEVLNTYEDLDGRPHDAHQSALWTVYRWKAPLFKRLYVLKRGQCPFCSLRGYRNCGKNPVMRVYWWLQSRGRQIVEDLVQHLLSKRDRK